jgi:hypothetical protein
MCKVVRPEQRAKTKQTKLRSARNVRVLVEVLVIVCKEKPAKADSAKPARSRPFVVIRKVAPKDKAVKTKRCNRDFALRHAQPCAIVPKALAVSKTFVTKIPDWVVRTAVPMRDARWINSVIKRTDKWGVVRRVLVNRRVIAHRAKIAAMGSV